MQALQELQELDGLLEDELIEKVLALLAAYWQPIGL